MALTNNAPNADGYVDCHLCGKTYLCHVKTTATMYIGGIIDQLALCYKLNFGVNFTTPPTVWLQINDVA